MNLESIRYVVTAMLFPLTPREIFVFLALNHLPMYMSS